MLLSEIAENSKIVELQIDSDNQVEASFKMPYALPLLNPLLSKVNIDVRHVDLVSFHEKDGLTYGEPTVTIVFSKKFRDDPSLLDFFASKVGLRTLSVKNKLYRRYTEQDLSFMAALGLEPATEFGVGYYESDPRFLDFYFWSTDVDKIYKKFGFEEPEASKSYSRYKWAAFGITVLGSKIVKLKRYVYPSFPEIENKSDVLGIKIGG